MINWTHHDVDANGITLHYCRTGNGGKPLLILAHGFSDNGLCWQRAAQRLESDFDVVMFDARNHGKSSPALASADAMVEDLKSLIEKLGCDKAPILLGHSMGATTVAGVAARYPELVSMALLEDPPWWSSATEEKSEAEREQERAKRTEGFKKYLDDMKSKTESELIAHGRKLYVDWHDDDLPAWATSKTQVDEGAMGGLKLPSWQDVALSISVPTLLIHTDGGRDGLLKPEVVEALVSQNQNLSAAEISNAGHNVRRENFEGYMAAVESYLQTAG